MHRLPMALARKSICRRQIASAFLHWGIVSSNRTHVSVAWEKLIEEIVYFLFVLGKEQIMLVGNLFRVHLK